MIKKFFSPKLILLLLNAILANSFANTKSFNLTHQCDSHSAPIVLANTLEDVVLLEITIITESNQKRILKRSKRIAPGGEQTLCIPNRAKFKKIIPCLKSIHNQDAKIYYTFNSQYDGNGILASIFISEYYPAII
ncbi:MAG: hypothetical protein HRT87_02325 [Legionellales bacterium]|nr:hypothetical protein [Legionellales bacterium]